MKIPPEIIHLIVNHAHDAKDTPTLRSFNATSRQFRLTAQRCLFSCINIVVNPEADEMGELESLREIFIVSPTAAHLVQKLVLGFEPGNPGEDPMCWSVLEMMPYVKQLTLERVKKWGWSMWKELPSWRHLNPNLRKAIQNLLRLEGLLHITVHEIMDFPLNALHSCCKGVQIVDLTLQQPDDKEQLTESDESFFDCRKKTYLKTCKLMGGTRRDFDILARALLQYPLQELKTLLLGSTEQYECIDMVIAQKFLNNSPPHLETFRLITTVTNDTGSLNLSLATSLVKLHLGIRGTPPDVLPWILQVLETLPGSGQIKTLYLNFGLNDSFGGHLSRLNAELTSPAKYAGCSIELYTFSLHSQFDVSTALVMHMKDLIQRPNTSIHNRNLLLDLEALRARIVTDVE